MNKFLLTLVLILECFTTHGQIQKYMRSSDGERYPSILQYPYRAEVSFSPTITTGGTVPFWMRSMNYGSIPLEGLSTSVQGKFYRDYDTEEKPLLDWGFGIDGRVNGGKRVEAILVEGYAKAKLAFLQLKIGRFRAYSGLVDSALSTGSFSQSGNALGIPQVQLGIPEYLSVPFLNDILAFKGDAEFGYMGKVPINYGGNGIFSVKTYNHHLSFYGRLGRPSWRLQLFTSINHDVVYGGDKLIFGDQYHLSKIGALYYVFTGKKYLGASDISKIGNHLGSVDFGIKYRFNAMTASLYHQFFYDKGALGYLANVKDGLTGIALSNNDTDRQTVNFKKVLFEFFYSNDQAGQNNAKFTPSGPEYYYNHAVYFEGFSYKGLGLGNSLISPASYARLGQISSPMNYFISNRVIGFHLAASLELSSFNINFKSTFSRNFGDYRTSGPDEQWFNGVRVKTNIDPLKKFKPVTQFSSFLQVFKRIPNTNYLIGSELAVDQGHFLNNSLGFSLIISKRL
ncbi:MAG: capsule assembly Wzi family protein [Bacteroidota bacterium]